MRPAEFKTLVHETVQATWCEDLAAYRNKVEEGGSIEDHRKLVDMGIKMLGLEVEKKVDERANLPMFNFTFTRAGMSLEQVTVIDSTAIDIPELFSPSAAMLSHASINQDLAGISAC